MIQVIQKTILIFLNAYDAHKATGIPKILSAVLTSPLERKTLIFLRYWFFQTYYMHLYTNVHEEGEIYLYKYDHIVLIFITFFLAKQYVLKIFPCQYI